MPQSFVLLGGNDKKLILENSAHPCPKCKKLDRVQLTRSEACVIILNKRIELPSRMRVRYECRNCHWKNETLPDDDPSFQVISNIEDVNYQQANRLNSPGTVCCSAFTSSVSINSYSSNSSANKK